MDPLSVIATPDGQGIKPIGELALADALGVPPVTPPSAGTDPTSSPAR